MQVDEIEIEIEIEKDNDNEIEIEIETVGELFHLLIEKCVLSKIYLHTHVYTYDRWSMYTHKTLTSRHAYL